MKDKKLVSRILRGERKAIQEFYKLYQPRLENYVLGKISDPADAEEIVQDAFLATINSLPNFDFRSSLFTYLCAVTNHEVVDFYRRKKLKTVLFSRFPFLETIAVKALTPEEEVLKNELKEEVKAVLKKINRRYRILLRLKYLKDLSIKEIAVLLKMTPKAVESALSRARKRFGFAWRNRRKNKKSND